jgi:hypothetical protein
LGECLLIVGIRGDYGPFYGLWWHGALACGQGDSTVPEDKKTKTTDIFY